MNNAIKTQETTWIWLAKALSGLLILVVIFLHMVVNHMVAEGGLMTFDDVVKYLSNPWIAFMEGSFLVIVIVHSLLGMRGIILDLRPKIHIIRWMDRILWIVGVAASAYGIWLLFAIRAYAA